MNRHLKSARWYAIALFAGASVFAASSVSHAAIVEKVVAIVGERPILLTELRERARPNLLWLASQPNRDASYTIEAEGEIYKNVLNQMIEDRLIEQAGEKAHVTVTPEQVDKGMAQMAAANHVNTTQLLAGMRAQNGLSEQDVREIIHRQLLEGQLLELRVRARVKVTDQDIREAYARFQQEFAKQSWVNFRAIFMSASAGEDAQKQEELAEQVATQARAGADFCALAAQYSLEQATKSNCGAPPGPQPTQMLPPQIQEAFRTMKVDDISDPVRVLMPGGQEAIAIVQYKGAAQVPKLDAVRAEMANRAFGEAQNRQRVAYIDELRRTVHVEVRL